MKFLVINTDYPMFSNWLYAQHPGLEGKSYAEQMQVRMESLFGDADFYSSNLRKLGHEAYDLRPNAEWMQKAWAQEHGLVIEQSIPERRGLKSILNSVRSVASKTPLKHLKPLFRPILRSMNQQPPWFYDVLAAQIKYCKPDVVFNLAMDSISTSFLQEVKEYMGLLIGCSEPPVLLNRQDWRVYDLIAAPSEGMLDYFNKIGLKTELLRFGFEPGVLLSLDHGSQKSVPVSFVGSIGSIHSERLKVLETLCAKLGEKICVWAPSGDHLSAVSSIRKRYQGPAFGCDSYQILSVSKITVNCHIDVAGQYADNMRLFEATGMGTMLITDWKINLHKMFESGREVITYRTAEECVDLVNYYLEHDTEREAIARAGQERTLREHTYYHRMQELDDLVGKYL